MHIWYASHFENSCIIMRLYLHLPCNMILHYWINVSLHCDQSVVLLYTCRYDLILFYGYTVILVY